MALKKPTSRKTALRTTAPRKPAPRKTAPRRTTTITPNTIVSLREPTHFLNVDLEIGARSKLDPLVAELAPLLFELYRGTEDKLDRAHFEVRTITTTVDATIRELVRILNKLTPAAKQIWGKARIRDFNVGIQAGVTPLSTELEIQCKTLQDVAALGGRIMITVYAPADL